jgi:hypothetical protein
MAILDLFKETKTDGFKVPAGTTAQRPNEPSTIRQNTLTTKLEFSSDGLTYTEVGSDGGAVGGGAVVLKSDSQGLISMPSGSKNLTLMTAQATTSGTSIDFIGIPSWAKRITVMFNGVSTNGSSFPLIQIGSGSAATTGYVSSGTHATTGVLSAAFTTGFGIEQVGDAGVLFQGLMTICLLNSSANLWVASGVVGSVAPSYTQTDSLAGTKTLSGTLDRIRLTTVNGTDTFDAGSVNIMYEG